MKTHAQFLSSLVLAAACAGLTSTRAATVLSLDNGPGVGTVGLDMDGFGSFGSAVSPTMLATFAPYGSGGTRYSTTFESAIGLKFTGGSPAANTWLSSDVFGSSGSLAAPSVTPNSAIAGTSTFSYGGLSFSLEQHVEAIYEGANQVGSRLVQTYNIVNNNLNTVSFDLLRYADADMPGVPGANGINTGGGRVVTDKEWLVSTLDDGGPGAYDNAWVAIAAEGGGASSSGRYQMVDYSSATGILGLTASLTDTIAGDGGDADQFVDAGNMNDYVMAMANGFTLGAGASSTYTTYTIFASGVPDQLATVPETSTLVGGVMLIGFMAFATAQRRRTGLSRASV